MKTDSICEKILVNTPDLICAIGENGQFVKVNAACRKILGYDIHELEAKKFIDFVHPDDVIKTHYTTQKILGGYAAINFKNRYLHKNGHEVSLTWSAEWSEDEKLIFCTARNTTDQETQQDIAAEKESLYQALIEHGSDMLALLDENGFYLFVSGAIPRILGYKPEQLIGTNAFELIHPEDLERIQQLWSKFAECQASILTSDLRYKTAKGNWIWIEAIVSDQLHNPAIKAYVLSSRDITERKNGRLKLQESEQKYRALFDNNPDIVVFENTEGLVTKVNQAFKDTFETWNEADVIGKPAASFLPPDMATVNEQSLQQALLGSILRYDLAYTTEDGKRVVLDTVKFPVIVDNRVIGAQTISKDITPIVNSFETIERQAKKLNTIFESITDAFFTLDKNWNYTYVNSEFERLTGAKEQDYVGKNILEVSEYGTEGIFYQHYKQALETGRSVHFEGYSKKADKWFEVKAFPSDEGLSVYFTDITEKIKAQQEVEKLSLVASNTTNGVIISDNNRRIEWVNEGFTRLTGYKLEEVKGKRPAEFLHNAHESGAFDAVKDKMLSGSPVSFEILINRKDGEQLWLYVQVNPILGNSGQLTGLVTIQTDITERVRTQKELEKLSLVASSTDNGVIITDATGKTEWVNEGFTSITGYTLEELAGKKPGDLLQGPGTDLDTVREISKNLQQGAHFNTTLINYKKHGDKFWVSMDITPIQTKDGAIVQYIAILRDITYRKEAEDNLLSLTQDLYLQNKNLQEFTYIVSHNLRAPVANALGLANMLIKTDRNAAAFDTSLAYLKASILKMDTVLKDVNLILSTKDKEGILKMEPVKPVDVFWQAYSHLQEPALLCGGEVIVDIPEDLCINANKPYLFSIFYNLFSNAVKYRSAKRKLQVRVSSCYDDAGKIVLSFSDNGTGFNTEKAGDDVFKLYKRFHKDIRGRGMGLFLVKAHARAMGWDIEVKSQEDQGTTFLIYINSEPDEDLPDRR